MPISQNPKKSNVPEFTSTELPEVLGGFGGDVGEKLHLDATRGDAADRDVEEDDWVFRVRWSDVPLHVSSAAA